jgi:carbonic anhydrase/acetyltransferase-like protein (isoleucine patch superfamily)
VDPHPIASEVVRKLVFGVAMAIRAFKGIAPRIHPSCFVEASAQIIGDVEIGESSSIWFNTVVRGDVNVIRIGRRTNIQDLCMVHVLKDRYATHIGDEVTVGHHVVLHGCRVGNRVLVGMGAVLMDDVDVGDDCVVAAGALLVPGTRVPPGSLALGSPAKVKRPLTPEERAWLKQSAENYVGYAAEYLRDPATK